MGLNEFAGYGAVALAALATGYVAATYGLRPEPFYLGVVFAVAGHGLSFFTVRETLGHARLEAANRAQNRDGAKHKLPAKEAQELLEIVGSTRADIVVSRQK